MLDAPPISEKARSSFWLGVLSLCLGFFTGVPAVVQGLRGLGDIRRSQGWLKGRALAVLGTVFGLTGSLAGATFLVVAVMRVRDAADRID